MNKLKDFLKGLKEKWTGVNKRKKIAFSIIFIGILASIIALSLYFGKTKYAVLFSNMDANDSGAILQKLKDKKVEAKVEGNNILVPKQDVDKLRMEMLSEVPITNGSKGFELLDKSQFGETDQEMKINYQRAIQGELERTIKSFPQVESSRVHLVLPDETAFVKETQPGRASVTLNLQNGQKIDKEQVKAIVALVSGSVKNIPKENVEVIDNNMNLLTKNLFDQSGSLDDATTSAEKQQQLKKSYEKDLQNRLTSMLEVVYGKDKIRVNVNADLDFDAVKTNSVTYDPKNVVVSEHNIKEKNQNNTGTGSNKADGSVVDNNMVNNVSTKNGENQTSSREETTKNYEISKVQQDSIKAPGSVKRMTASIVLDSNIDEQTKSAVRNLAISAIGYNEKRGDSISIEGIPFDTADKDKVKKDIEQMEKSKKLQDRIKLFTTIGLAALVLAGLIIFFVRKRREDDEELGLEGIDMLIDDNTEENKNMPKFKPIDLEANNEKTHVENEIRKYAKNKPEQVAEIIKSWLAEDER